MNKSLRAPIAPVDLTENRLFQKYYVTGSIKRDVCMQIGEGGGVAQWLGRRISDQGVPGSIPGRCTFRCGLEQVTFTLLSTG